MGEREEQVKVNRGLAWVGSASALTSVLNVVVIGVVLAVFITPTEYGTATLALAAFPILDLATDMGLSSALIQTDDHSQARLSTIFWLNVAMVAALIAAVALLIAPGLAYAYDAPIAGQMLQVYCIKLVLQNIYYIPYAIMTRELRFREVSLVRVIGNFLENLAVLVMAATGLGIWCFVLAPLLRTLALAIGFQRYAPWAPSLRFDWRATRDLVMFGLKTSGSKILFFIYTGLDSYVVGYYFGREALGLYKAACDLALDPARILSGIVVSVAFPTFARARAQPDRLAAQFLQFARVNFIIIAGLLIGVVVAAPALLELLDPAWVPAATAVRILSIAALLRGLSMVLPPLLDSLGRPTLTLQYMTVAAVTMPACFVVGAAYFGEQLGFVSVAWAWVIGYPFAFAVLLFFALRVLAMRLSTYVMALAPLVIWASLAVIAGLAVATSVADLHAPIARAAIPLGAAALVYFGFLARFEGITATSLRTALRAPPTQQDTGSSEPAPTSGA